MNNFDLIVIGACHGFWLENDIKKCSNKILLIEPVKYNFDQLKNRFKNYKNINWNIGNAEKLKFKDNTFDSCVTDPPYHLASIVKRFGPGQKPINNQDTKMGRDGPFHRAATGFMGQTWDGGDIAFKTEIWKEVFRVLKPGSVLLAFAATRNYHRLAVAIEDSGFEIFDMINWIYSSGFPKRKNLLKPAHEPIVMARKGVNKELNLDECRVGNEEIDTSKINSVKNFLKTYTIKAL